MDWVSIVAMGIVVAATIVAAVLLVPIHARADGALGEDELWGAAELRWGHGIARIRVRSEGGGRVYLLGIPVFAFSSVSKPREDAKKSKRKKPRRPRAMRLVAQDPRVVARMMRRGFRALHAEIYVGGTLGLGDPADTATLFTALRQIDLRATDRLRLDLHDDFLNETTQLFGRVSAWTVPAEVGLILLAWVIRSDTRQVLRAQMTR